MLIALLAAFLLGGGGASGAILTPSSAKAIGKSIEATVQDGERLEAASVTVKDLRAEVKAFDKTFAKSGKALAKLYKNHGATAEQMKGVLDDLNGEWSTAQARAIELRFELKDSLTAEEWQAIFGE
jgi:16S rRNA C1402 N4-methylase RsmH